MKLLLERWNQFVNEAETGDVVRQAFKNTDPEYLKTSVAQRNPGPQAAGSTFSSPITPEDLINADWEPYDHPNINSPATAFKAPIPGILGIAEIKGLPAEQRVRFQPAHGGKVTVKDEASPKFGQHLAEVVTQIPEGNRNVKHTTLILGPSREDPKQLTMWTFFPGDPTPKFPDITMDDVRKALGSEEKVVEATVADAVKMGYSFVKHVDGL
jgi:hypothetical protein